MSGLIVDEKDSAGLLVPVSESRRLFALNWASVRLCQREVHLFMSHLARNIRTATGYF